MKRLLRRVFRASGRNCSILVVITSLKNLGLIGKLALIHAGSVTENPGRGRHHKIG